MSDTLSPPPWDPSPGGGHRYAEAPLGRPRGGHPAPQSGNTGCFTDLLTGNSAQLNTPPPMTMSPDPGTPGPRRQMQRRFVAGNMGLLRKRTSVGRGRAWELLQLISCKRFKGAAGGCFLLDLLPAAARTGRGPVGLQVDMSSTGGHRSARRAWPSGPMSPSGAWPVPSPMLASLWIGRNRTEGIGTRFDGEPVGRLQTWCQHIEGTRARKRRASGFLSRRGGGGCGLARLAGGNLSIATCNGEK